MKQQFEENIKHAIDKGWDCFGWKGTSSFEWHTTGNGDGIWVYEKLLHHNYSISDIYASHDFFKAIAGEEMVCAFCGCTETYNPSACEVTMVCADCDIVKRILAYLYHIAECVKLFSPEEQTDYVSKVIEGEL